MKRNLFLSLIVLTILCGCDKKKECRYGMIYDSVSEECECQNLSLADIPELSHDNYNSISVINKNFSFLVKQDSDYPFYSHEGDTMKVFGWIWEKHPVASDKSSYVLIDQPAVPVGSSCNALNIVDLERFWGAFNEDEKCYVKGILEFPELLETRDITSGEQICHNVKYVIRIIEIKNSNSNEL